MSLKKAVVLVAMMCSMLCAAETPATAPSGPDAILAEIDALPRPGFDSSRGNDSAYVESYHQTMAATWKRQSELELEFYQLYPNHPKAEMLLIRRWGNALTSHSEDRDQIQGEIDQYLKAHPNGPASEEDRGTLAIVERRLVGDDPDKILAVAERFAKNEPGNELAADFFLSAARAMNEGGERDKLLRGITLDYPNSDGAIGAGGILRRASQIGMPFNLGFFDLATGQWIHTRWLRPKVVVVDFWATWCGPCVGDIPHLQKVYAQYKDRGLEILGVSLDGAREGTSLDTLKDFIAKRQITWPQYYQGNGFDSAVSASWGINAIPAVFVIDQQGRLYSTDADREKLDMILAKLLPAAK